MGACSKHVTVPARVRQRGCATQYQLGLNGCAVRIRAHVRAQGLVFKGWYVLGVVYPTIGSCRVRYRQAALRVVVRVANSWCVGCCMCDSQDACQVTAQCRSRQAGLVHAWAGHLGRLCWWFCSPDNTSVMPKCVLVGHAGPAACCREPEPKHAVSLRKVVSMSSCGCDHADLPLAWLETGAAGRWNVLVSGLVVL